MIESAESVDDPEEIRETLGGSPTAFGEIVRRYQGEVRMIISKWVRCAATADDIAQEVFVAAYENLNRFDDQRSLKAWLVGIAKNKTKLYLRSEARRRNRESDPLHDQVLRWKAEQLESEVLIDTSEHASLARCLGKLAPGSRQLVEKHYFDGMTLESIARESNRTGGSLRMMLLRIRKALAKCIRGTQQ